METFHGVRLEKRMFVIRADSRSPVQDASTEEDWIAVASDTMANNQRNHSADCSCARRVLAITGGGSSSGFRLRIPYVGMDNDDS